VSSAGNDYVSKRN